MSGPADEVFVWPRAQPYDRTRQADFEDENPNLAHRGDEPTLDLRTFPSEELHRVVVVAGPGYGKSALLTAIACDLAESPIVPVHVPLASLASANTSVLSLDRKSTRLNSSH